MQHTEIQNLTLKDQVIAEPGGEHLLRCYACGTCVSTCLVGRVSSDFNPRRTMHLVMLDKRKRALGGSTAWLCSACDLCYPRCPQGIHISELMGAIKNVALREGYEPPGPVAVVDETKCSGCDVCEKSCPYQALSLVMKEVDGKERKVSQVDKNLCMNCGICAAACPLSAITIEEFSNEKVAACLQAGGWLTDTTQLPPGEPRLLVFNCNWCLRADADLEALTQFPTNVRVVTVPCSGRVDPTFVLMAMKEGVDGVLVAGCEPGECHYKQGTRIAQGRMHVLQRMFGQMGLDSGRVRFVQLGTEERGRLPALVEQMMAEMKAQAVPASVTL
jgi:coenzyme F420-reducing hydrogenase delta subunit/heterodisulfide reductase subunit C